MFKNETSNFDLIEQGVLFSLFIDPMGNYVSNEKLTGNQNQKSTTNPNNERSRFIDKTKFREISFWVVGRRKLRRDDPSSAWKSHGDLFICFNDSLDHVLVELAFDMGFSKLAI